MLLSLLKKLTKIVIKPSINSAYARCRGAIGTRFQHSNSDCPFPGQRRPLPSSVLRLLCKLSGPPGAAGPRVRARGPALCSQPGSRGRPRVRHGDPQRPREGAGGRRWVREGACGRGRSSCGCQWARVRAGSRGAG